MSRKECSIGWCDRPAKGLGLCGGHHQRLKNGVDMNKPWRTGSGLQCTASPTCQRSGKVGNRGMCGRHYRADQSRRRNDGDWAGHMPADEVNAHIAKLVEAGMSLQRIAHIAHLSEVGVRKLRTRKRVWRTNGEKILEIRSEAFYATETGFVPVLGPARRVQALVALGYTQRELAARAGITETCIDQLLNGRTSQVCMATARAIDKIFREQQLQVPPPSRGGTAARLRAQRRGWALPLAWDEDSIDDPDAEPYVVERTKARADWWDSYLELLEFGMSPQSAAERLGISWDTVYSRIRHNEKRAA